MTLKLPKYEMYEQGSQVRRSTKSIKNNIVEGYGRKRYKQEFIRFLVFAHASCDEADLQLTMIDEIYFESKGLTDLISEYEILGRKISINLWNMLNKIGMNPEPETCNLKHATCNVQRATCNV